MLVPRVSGTSYRGRWTDASGTMGRWTDGVDKTLWFSLRVMARLRLRLKHVLVSFLILKTNHSGNQMEQCKSSHYVMIACLDPSLP